MAVVLTAAASPPPALTSPHCRLNLVITYPTPFRIPAVETGLVNQRETPTLLVDVLVYRGKEGGMDGMGRRVGHT